jgi:hypothetical protein
MSSSSKKRRAAPVEDGLRPMTAEDRKPRNLERVLPPISKATGGLKPGVDLGRTCDIQERDDFDSMECMKRVE